MATRWLAARRPRHRTSVPTQPARVRSLLFDRKLVSRLHRLLRRLRRWQETLRGRRAGRTAQANPKGRCWRQPQTPPHRTGGRHAGPGTAGPAAPAAILLRIALAAHTRPTDWLYILAASPTLHA